MKCRHCREPLVHTFLDLGFAPPSNAYLSEEDLSRPENYYPLRIKLCESCWLVQTEDYASANEFFSPDYAYFSSTSKSWLEHAANYVEHIIRKLDIKSNSLVIEVASNDGYLLKNFIKAGIPCLGIEPTLSTAEASEKLGISVLREFFGEALGKRLSSEGNQADLIIGNNVYADVPDINDFTRGLKLALKPGGVITLEFPHLMQMIEFNQFDTVYHEHFSYLSLHTVSNIFNKAGLRIWSVEELSSHGGSLRVYGCHDDDIRETDKSVLKLLKRELDFGLQRVETYLNFQFRAEEIKDSLLDFLIEKKRNGDKVVAYGAAAKGNTLLNFAGIKPDLLPIVYDAAISKQGKYMPGSHIPIMPPSHLMNANPDFVLILPWNIADEVQEQYSGINNRKFQFLTAVPTLKVME